MLPLAQTVALQRSRALAASGKALTSQVIHVTLDSWLTTSYQTVTTASPVYSLAGWVPLSSTMQGQYIHSNSPRTAVMYPSAAVGTWYSTCVNVDGASVVVKIQFKVDALGLVSAKAVAAGYTFTSTSTLSASGGATNDVWWGTAAGTSTVATASSGAGNTGYGVKLVSFDAPLSVYSAPATVGRPTWVQPTATVVPTDRPVYSLKGWTPVAAEVGGYYIGSSFLPAGVAPSAAEGVWYVWVYNARYLQTVKLQFTHTDGEVSVQGVQWSYSAQDQYIDAPTLSSTDGAANDKKVDGSLGAITLGIATTKENVLAGYAYGVPSFSFSAPPVATYLTPVTTVTDWVTATATAVTTSKPVYTLDGWIPLSVTMRGGGSAYAWAAKLGPSATPGIWYAYAPDPEQNIYVNSNMVQFQVSCSVAGVVSITALAVRYKNPASQPDPNPTAPNWYDVSTMSTTDGAANDTFWNSTNNYAGNKLYVGSPLEGGSYGIKNVKFLAPHNKGYMSSSDFEAGYAVGGWSYGSWDGWYGSTGTAAVGSPWDAPSHKSPSGTGYAFMWSNGISPAFTIPANSRVTLSFYYSYRVGYKPSEATVVSAPGMQDQTLSVYNDWTYVSYTYTIGAVALTGDVRFTKPDPLYNESYVLADLVRVYIEPLGTTGGTVGMQATSAVAAYDYNTAGDQTFTVPPGLTSLNLAMWGAAGGTGVLATLHPGGAGAFVEGTLSVTGGEVLTLVVGKGGETARIGYGSAGVYGGGGGVKGENTTVTTSYSGTGGGRSAVCREDTLQAGNNIVVAGGGGGGFNNAIGGAATWTGAGLDGPYPSFTTYYNYGRGGKADGSNTAASGTGGSATYQGAAGTALQGGIAGAYVGGGGGGWGGGGGASANGGDAGGGGGGSSRTALLTNASGENSSNGTLAPRTASPYYKAGVARGNATAGGGNGRVVLAYTPPVYSFAELFGGVALDTTRWYSDPGTGGTVSVSDGALTISGFTASGSTKYVVIGAMSNVFPALVAGMYLEIRARVSYTNNSGYDWGLKGPTNEFKFHTDYGNYNKLQSYVTGKGWTTHGVAGTYLGVMRTYRIEFTAAGDVKFLVDGVVLRTVTGMDTTETFRLTDGIFFVYDAGTSHTYEHLVTGKLL